MLRNLLEAKEYIKNQGASDSTRQERANNLTLVSFVIKDAYDLLTSQLEKVGYTGLPLIDRVEFCLASTTQSCPEEQFQELIHILTAADAAFKQTKLYVALCIVRSLCSGDTENSVLEYIIIPEGKTKAEFLDIVTDLHFFSGFLVETLIRQLHAMKSNLQNTSLDAKKIKAIFDSKFEPIVLDLVQKISAL